MKKFSDFGIKTTSQAFTGDKIKISKILNKEITVHDYKIEKSKYNGECLYLQIEFKESKCVVFTGSVSLMNQIKQVEKDDMPFQTTIIQENERFEFT